MELKKISYKSLNSRQQENFNYQKISSVLADYGFITHRLSDDWQGADFIAQHINGSTFLKVQLKGRLTFEKKYIGKDIWIVFNSNNIWYLYPHDQLLKEILDVSKIGSTSSWKDKGGYSFPHLSTKLKYLLEKFIIEKI
jgi:hypothetical protein